MKEKKNITFIAVILLLLSMLCINFISPTTAATPKINVTKKTLVRGQSYKLKITGTTRSVKWSSSNKKIATVKKDGKHGAVVKTKRTGKVTITAKIGSKRLKCRITVKSKGLNKTSLTLKTGQTTVIRMLNARGVKWYSSNKKIARITKTTSRAVRIKGMKAGKTYINGQIGKKKFRCRVTVKAKKKATSTAKTQKADGLYLYKTKRTKHPYSYRYYYKGKWYDFYELPRSTELALAKKNTCFAEYFKYLAKYKKLISDNTEATLVAINHYTHDKEWKYDNSKYLMKDMSRMFIYHTGVCQDFVFATNYLCYLSGVDAIFTANTNHAVSAIKYKNKWYYLDSTYVSSEDDFVGYLNFNVNLDEHYLATFKTGYTVDQWSKLEVWKNAYYFSEDKDWKVIPIKTASGHIPTKTELLASSGTPELKNVFHIDYKYSFSYESYQKMLQDKAEDKANNTVYSIKTWTSDNVSNGVVVGKKHSLIVKKTYQGSSVSVDASEWKSSNPGIAKIVSEKIGDDMYYSVQGVSAGIATIIAIADGKTTSITVTVY